MKCHRSAQLDLAAFLAGEATDEVDAFREHYPDCPDCSAEVRAWLELHTELDPEPTTKQHPSEDLLLRFETEPEKMSAVAKTSVETHLKTCPSCRDELRTLRAFDFSLLEQPATQLPPTPVPPRKDRAARWRDFLAPVRTVLLHPAFAYGLVILLLLPQVASLLRKDGPPMYNLETPAAQRLEAPAPPVTSYRSSADEQIKAHLSDQIANAPIVKKPPSRPAAAAPLGGTAPSEGRPRSRQETGQDTVELLADVGPSALLNEKRELDSLGQAASRAAFEDADAENERAAELAMSRTFRNDTPDDERKDDEQKVLSINMDPSGRNNLPVHGVLSGATMRIKPQRPLPAGSEAAIRIKSADGRRELREIRVASRDGYLRMTIPPGWMPDGAYSVEVLPLGQVPQAPPPHQHEAVH